MSFFSDNIRYLRVNKNISQQKIADDIIITRARFVSYEDGRSEPPIEILIKLSIYFKISIDLLVRIDIRKYSFDEMVNLSDNRIILPIKVGQTGENKIEVVPHKGSMGYLIGYNEPNYIENLQHMSLPFFRNGNYRAFPVEGDSMPPYNDGTFIIGKYVENKENLTSGTSYIFITTEGIVYKRFNKYDELGILVNSDNTFYESYKIEWSGILEIWEFAGSINTKELKAEHSEYHEIKDMFYTIRKDLQKLMY